MPVAATPPAPPPKPVASTPPPTKPSSLPPSKPPKPTTTETPSGRSQETAFDDAFADLDQIQAKSEGKAIAPVKPKKEELKPEKKEDEKVIPEDDDDYIPEEKPKEKEPADEKPKPEEKPLSGPKELRTQYEKSKATIKEKEAEISRLKTELETKAKSNPEADKALRSELESTKKRLKEYEEELWISNRQKSQKFKDEYEKPYHDAFARALSEFEQLNVSDEEGKSRKATREDLDALLRMSVSEVDRVATESFGPSAARVIRHVEKLRDLGDAYQSSLGKAKQEFAEREKNQASESKAAQEQRDNWWNQYKEEGIKKYPHWFAEKEGDQEVNDALKKGYSFADSAFTPEEGITPEQLTKRHAALRNKAAGFHRLVVELKRANTRIAELEKAAAELEESEPPAGEGGGIGGKVTNGRWEDNAFAELDEIDKKFKR